MNPFCITDTVTDARLSFSNAVCTTGMVEVVDSNYYFSSSTNTASPPVTTYTPCDILIFTGADDTLNTDTPPVLSGPPI